MVLVQFLFRISEYALELIEFMYPKDSVGLSGNLLPSTEMIIQAF